MSLFPELDSASFDAELPFSVQPLPGGICPARQERETRLALRVLAAPTETLPEADPMLVRLEAKLDLALEVSLLSRHPERPPLTPCRLGLDSIAWISDHANHGSEPVLVALCPNPDSALLLFLAARISTVTPGENGNYLIRADISGAFDEATRLLWEKWVFRRHRKAILER
ncbi:hypothetical protein [Chromobacterium haemolyticum]|uniref:hypothetical protein n=1 Tax=Chromobacterium haemolyticum TaxID=394935 RepID=UPI0013167B84|nr:hypothetical protein [Chromobacterium haemolyticum]BBH13990.1 hypothetical protein CH06BL_32380 [Chromobacterium haemolyticum]